MIGTFELTLRLAWRNLWRNRRRTLIMLAAAVLGVWAMVFMTALMRGMVDDMVEDGIRALPGHVQIHHPDYQDDPSVANSIAPPDGALRRALDGPPVEAWTARVRVPAVISSERGMRGVTLVGVEPAGERRLSFVADSVDQGRFIDSAADDGLVVGHELLARLETGLGKRVVVMSQDTAGKVADRGFRVVGVFHAPLASQEERFVFTGRGVVQGLLGLGEQVSEVAIRGPDYRNVEPIRSRIEHAASAGLAVQSWDELDPYLGSMLSMMDGFVVVWILVVFLALAFGLVNTLVMAVFERIREIGLMLALGMAPRHILAQIVLESALLLALALALGDGLAWASVEPIKGGIDLAIVGEGMEMWGAGAVLRPALLWQDVVLANGIVLALGLVASLSPAWRASRYEPVAAITKV